MKLFQRQLIPMLIFWAAVFGAVVYVSFTGLNAAIDEMSRQSTIAIVNHLHPEVTSFLARKKNKANLSLEEQKSLEALVRTKTEDFELLLDFFLVSEGGKVLFSLNKTASDSLPSNALLVGRFENERPRSVHIRRSEAGMDAVWPLRTGSGFAVVRVNPRIGVLRTMVHDTSVKMYLIGFSGIVGALLLAFVSTRVIKSPLNKISRALTALNRRKHRYRLRWKHGDEFGSYYEKVNQALQRLEQLDSAQRLSAQQRNALLREMKTLTRFLDIMSHEIKNPLHALGINLDVLKTKITKGQSREATLKHVEILEQEIDHLQEVVLGFLSYVRPGTPKKERTDINALIKEVCQMVSAEAEKAKIRIETRLGRNLKPLSIDASQIKQGLHNVVINAIHATSEGGKINIRSWAKKNKVLIEVKDSGTGISKEDMKKIFDLYYTTKKSGSGLGLPVTRRIIEVNGGQMHLDSTLGKGTKITFIFPT